MISTSRRTPKWTQPLSCYAVIAFLACAQAEHHTPSPDSRVRPSEVDYFEASARFREVPERRLEVAEKAGEGLAVGMELTKVQELLGPSDRVSWNFTLFYSSNLGLTFDMDGHLTSIFSDLTSEAIEGGSLALLEPEVQEAGKAFRTHRFSRQEYARILLSAIKIGMADKDLAPLLGKPDAVFWEYDLRPSEKAELSIAFDSAGQVTAINAKMP